ncbi:MAG: hypothetical protein V4474_02165 [Patescibacteria group bacterium]
MTTLSKIRDIFYSGTYAFNGDGALAGEIAFLLDNGYLHMTSFVVIDKQTYLRKAEEVGTKTAPHDISAGGGNTHIALKLITAEFLERERGQKMQFEQPLCGYYPDVVSADRTLVAECGHTQNPDKMLAYFRQGGVLECLQVPYPNEEDTSVMGYSFRPQIGFSDFMQTLDRQRHLSILDIVNKRDKNRGL